MRTDVGKFGVLGLRKPVNPLRTASALWATARGLTDLWRPFNCRHCPGATRPFGVGIEPGTSTADVAVRGTNPPRWAGKVGRRKPEPNPMANGVSSPSGEVAPNDTE